MDRTNGTDKTKQVFFSIESYNEKHARVIKKIQTNGLFASFRNDSSKEAPKILPRGRPMSLDITDSTALPKRQPVTPPSTPVPSSNGQSIEKPTCPLNNGSCDIAANNGTLKLEKPIHPPKFNTRSISLEPDHLRNGGKVALTIASYEGEPRTPMRLEFLPQSRNSPTSSKGSSSDASSFFDDDNESISSKLQSELVATLKRSNLKKKNDVAVSKSVSFEENGEDNQAENEDDKQEAVKESEQKSEIVNNVNVKEIASVLDKTLVFRE